MKECSVGMLRCFYYLFYRLSLSDEAGSPRKRRRRIEVEGGTRNRGQHEHKRVYEKMRKFNGPCHNLRLT